MPLAGSACAKTALLRPAHGEPLWQRDGTFGADARATPANEDAQRVRRLQPGRASADARRSRS